MSMQDQQEEQGVVNIINPEVIAQQDRAVVDVQISTSKLYPRNLSRAVNDCLAIIQMDRETAEGCIYAVPRDGKTIQGPSVKLAKIIAQQFGNMRIRARVVAIDDNNITSSGLCWDLEKNLAVEVEVKRSILTKYGKRYSESMITTTGNAANSIALRNAVYATVPSTVVDKCLRAAKAMITGDVSDQGKLNAARKKLIDALRDTYSVTEEEILKSINRASIALVDGDDLVTLTGYGTAIKDGDATVDNIFRGKQTADKEGAVTLEDLQMLYIEVEAKMTPKLKTDADRIIKNKEENSYKKLHKQLSEIK